MKILSMANQSQPTVAGASTITFPNVARALTERVKWLEMERANIQRFAQASMKERGVPDLDSKKHHDQIKRVREYLYLLEFDANMSPELRDKARIEAVLELMNRPKVYFPEDVKRRAAMLLQRFRDDNWGVGVEVEEDDDDLGSDDDDDEAVASPSTATAPVTTAAPTAPAAPAAPAGEPRNATVVLRLPPANHPVWGVNGIMDGIAVKQGSNTYVLNPNSEQRLAKVSGHNGLAVGAWFPMQRCALAKGAHGMPVAGISGSADYGAYSIVVAGGAYKEVDEDRGETLWYSVPGSATNQKKNEISPSAGTSHLQTSYNTGNPVRVLRSAKKKSAYAPSVGIRYDGLYEVVNRNTSHNTKGGLFVRYLLRRLPDQKPLEDVMLDSPTAQQMADFRRIRDLW